MMEPSTEPSAPSSPDGPQAINPQNEIPEAAAAPHQGAEPSSPVREKYPTPRAQLVLGFKDRILFYLMAGVVHTLSLIPDFLLYPIGIGAGFIGYLLDRQHIPIGMTNLAIAFPEKSEAERRRILRASYINLGRSAAEVIRLGGFFYKRMKRRVSYDRYEYFCEVVERKPQRGVIILSAHFGNFELLSTAHAMHGFQIDLVHHTQRFLAGDALLTFIRKHAAARPVLKALRRGDSVGIPFDQNAKRSEAIFVPFFNEMAATASGLARLVAISRAAVVPAFIVRNPDMRSHRIEVQNEVPVQRSGDAEADMAENTRRFVKVIEETARRYPEQFLWTHRRYRTRPRGMPPIYPPKKKR
jgi:KDO2-lipid IV(A) lauroyltransferase